MPELSTTLAEINFSGLLHHALIIQIEGFNYRLLRRRAELMPEHFRRKLVSRRPHSHHLKSREGDR